MLVEQQANKAGSDEARGRKVQGKFPSQGMRENILLVAVLPVTLSDHPSLLTAPDETPCDPNPTSHR